MKPRLMNIRNFVIIAHIDHGKSTLADRFLELTGTVEKRKMREQFLDQMELEREKGITIKMQPVRMEYAHHGEKYVLNLIDTPGHVDFTYEVSRALAAVEGAILLVDGTQGIQAQTVANLNLARKEKLIIIPAINKIDLQSSRTEETKSEIMQLLGCTENDIHLVSGKTGAGVIELLDAVIAKIPPPQGNIEKPFRALIFDSQFDAYKGVMAHVRVVDGALRCPARLLLAKTKGEFEALELGTFQPMLIKRESLSAGDIGYIASGLKETQLIRVGDTITRANAPTEPLSGYREPKPMVFASIYPESADDYDIFRDALLKLKLSDAALFFEPESSTALGRGFRVGFLGMLHLEIISERLRREYGLALILSNPSVSYQIKLKSGAIEEIYSAAKFPLSHLIQEIQEPWAILTVITSEKYIGNTMRLLEEIRGKYVNTEYLSAGRVEITYEAPLKEIIVDFYDRLKSITEGYGSMGYDVLEYRLGNLVKLDILIAGEPNEAFAEIVPREMAFQEGKRLAAKLKELLPRQLFPIAIQASVSGDIIARETVPAMKKDVTGYLYGGDRTRKMKLWKKQQRGKKRLKERGVGSVEIPPEVFLKMLKK
ncbi:MAG: translation elongation factor 4 [bacterium]|nr:translation elongation factor 4 [bacterium]